MLQRTRLYNNAITGSVFKHLKPFQQSTKAVSILKTVSIPTTKHLSAKIDSFNQHQDIKISHTFGSYYNNFKLINLSLKSSLDYLKPVAINCVIDVSGSMNGRVVDSSKDEENSKFSKLDLVKHALNTI